MDLAVNSLTHDLPRRRTHSYGPLGPSPLGEPMPEPTNFTKEEVIPIFTSPTPTDPATLEWAPIAGLFGGALRLRMRITEQTLSVELLDAIRHTRYPDADVPEVLGLRRVLGSAASRASIAVRLDPGPRDLQTGFVGYFQPFLVHWPFAKATLVMTIAPGEFQWNLGRAKKERGPDAERLEVFKKELLEGTRGWLRNLNR